MKTNAMNIIESTSFTRLRGSLKVVITWYWDEHPSSEKIKTELFIYINTSYMLLGSKILTLEPDARLRA